MTRVPTDNCNLAPGGGCGGRLIGGPSIHSFNASGDGPNDSNIRKGAPHPRRSGLERKPCHGLAGR